jgi:hypothetical protein
MYIIRKILTYFTVLETVSKENSFYYITVIVDRQSVCVYYFILKYQTATELITWK